MNKDISGWSVANENLWSRSAWRRGILSAQCSSVREGFRQRVLALGCCCCCCIRCSVLNSASDSTVLPAAERSIYSCDCSTWCTRTNQSCIPRDTGTEIKNKSEDELYRTKATADSQLQRCIRVSKYLLSYSKRKLTVLNR